MNYFQNIAIFSHISEQDQKNLSDFCQTQKLLPGDVLFHEGDEPQALYVVISWMLQVEKMIHDVPQTIATLSAGDMVGEMAFLGKQSKRNATVRALQESHVVAILHFWIDQLLLKYPKLYENFLSILEERLKK